ncbi:MAG: ribonuclease J [Dehalococcoidia bacterium]|nr:ribonuclease J [Dehalococcoidia bacterium]
MSVDKLRVIPLGGLGEIGKNMMALEYGDDILLIDAGLMFPEEEMLGIDLVIPDTSYLLDKKDRICGLVITHGHEDHIGALPYILPSFSVPVYSTPLTHGLISVKLKEHRLLAQSQLNVVQIGDTIHLGVFSVEFLPVNHSIPDATALAIRTPVGVVIHSGDFKLDHTPVDGRPTSFARLAQLGAEGVLLLLSDSTYAEMAGYTPSEKVVGDFLERIMSEAPGRVIVATFASLISRVQQVIDAAVKYNRKVMVTGRSMIANVEIARDLGYLKIPQGTLVGLKDLESLRPDRVTIVATGTQGEPTSSLVRMANGDHPQIQIVPKDTVILSATPIPGNEALVNRTIDNLFRLGASVYYSKISDVHVHGHGSQEELKMMISLTRPRYFVPIHGEFRHLTLHAHLAHDVGVPPERTFVMEDGDVLELDFETGRIVDKIPYSNVYVDGLGVGDIGQVVLRDRQALSRDGIVVIIVTADKRTGKIVGRPDLISRGFVDARESDALIEKAKDVIVEALSGSGEGLGEAGFVSSQIKDIAGRFLHKQTHRRPMILPVVVMV